MAIATAGAVGNILLLYCHFCGERGDTVDSRLLRAAFFTDFCDRRRRSNKTGAASESADVVEGVQLNSKRQTKAESASPSPGSCSVAASHLTDEMQHLRLLLQDVALLARSTQARVGAGEEWKRIGRICNRILFLLMLTACAVTAICLIAVAASTPSSKCLKE
jgi:hypothetical protein